MSYARDNDDIEQSAQGESLDNPDSDYIKVCAYFGLTEEEFARHSNNEQKKMHWNYRTFGRKK